MAGFKNQADPWETAFERGVSTVQNTANQVKKAAGDTAAAVRSDVKVSLGLTQADTSQQRLDQMGVQPLPGQQKQQIQDQSQQILAQTRQNLEKINQELTKARQARLKQEQARTEEAKREKTEKMHKIEEKKQKESMLQKLLKQGKAGSHEVSKNVAG